MINRLEALDQLMTAIFGHETRGHHVPCVDPKRGHMWLSDDVELQEAAVHQCRSCPALDACRAYIEQFPENGGTWAGRAPRRQGRLPEVLR